MQFCLVDFILFSALATAVLDIAQEIQFIQRVVYRLVMPIFYQTCLSYSAAIVSTFFLTDPDENHQ